MMTYQKMIITPHTDKYSYSLHSSVSLAPNLTKIWSNDGINRRRFDDPRFDTAQAMAALVKAYNLTAWRI